MADYLDQVSEFVTDTSFDDLPGATVERARRVIADTIAAIAAGSAEPEVATLTARMAAQEGPSSVIGAGRRTQPATAAFLNGTSGTFLELDEGNQFSRGHPGVHALPSALAVAEDQETSGQDFLTAIVLGYEIGARIGIAAKILPTMHPHGTWGTVGSAIAVAKLMGANASQVRELINIASTLGLATSRQTMLQGGTVRNSFAGFSGQIGIMAWDMLESGFTGEADGLTTIWSKVISTEWRPEEMTNELGSRYEIARNYFKRHACCRYNHGTLDAMAMIDKECGGLRAEDIDRIRVETYSLAAELSDPNPTNTLAGKFSVPFAVASTLMNQSSGVESFTWEKIRDPAIQAFADKVEVFEDPALTAMMPDFRPSRVTVRLHDGTELSAEAKTNRGDTEDPYDDDELDQKYAELSGRVWDTTVANSVYDHCFAIERLADVNELTGCFNAGELKPASTL